MLPTPKAVCGSLAPLNKGLHAGWPAAAARRLPLNKGRHDPPSGSVLSVHQHPRQDLADGWRLRAFAAHKLLQHGAAPAPAEQDRAPQV